MNGRDLAGTVNWRKWKDRGKRLLGRTKRCWGSGACILSYYGALKIETCNIACVSVGYTRSGGRTRWGFGVGGLGTRRKPGLRGYGQMFSATWTPGAVRSSGFSGSSNFQGCRYGCLGFGKNVGKSGGSVSFGAGFGASVGQGVFYWSNGKPNGGGL